jgi:type IV pilus assembly protein PilB
MSVSIEGYRSAAEIIRSQGLVDEATFQRALETSRSQRIGVEEALLDMKAVPKSEILRLLEDAWRIPAVNLEKIDVDAEIVKTVSEALSRQIPAVAFRKDEGILFIAIPDPKRLVDLDVVKFQVGLDIKPYLALRPDIETTLDRVYGKPETILARNLLNRSREPVNGGDSDETQQKERSEIFDVDVTDSEARQFLKLIIQQALNLRASDIHIEPMEDASGKSSKVGVRYRVDGNLVAAPIEVPWRYRDRLIRLVKIDTGLKPDENRIPQSGRFEQSARGAPIQFRVEIVPTAFGESCVMRILDSKAVKVDIDKMGFLPDTLDKLKDLLKGVGGKKNFGLIVICGPTGSGKSTTLYAALNHINNPRIKILTAENPVEYNLSGIVQVPVNPDLKIKIGDEAKSFDFALAMRSFLRLDPDVIMIGEMRDRETAQIAMEAAMTGHLVFSTIHTNDAASAIPRLIEMGCPAYLVASTVKAVMAQRLSRRLCPECKKPRAPTAEEIRTFEDHGLPLAKDEELYDRSGEECKACKNLGFSGRLPLHELLVMSEPLRSLSLKEVVASVLRDAALKEGMRLIVQDGLLKVRQGLTTTREVLGGMDS